jgi:hypothetical protein
MVSLSSVEKRSVRKLTFPIDDVLPAREALPLEHLGKSLQLRSGCSIVALRNKTTVSAKCGMQKTGGTNT